MNNLAKYEPQLKESCLCGSGINFKNCCKNKYNSNSKAFQYYNNGQYKQALARCRHHITWYILCHRAHTIPFLLSEEV